MGLVVEVHTAFKTQVLEGSVHIIRQRFFYLALDFYCFCPDSSHLTSKHLFLDVEEIDTFLMWLRLDLEQPHSTISQTGRNSKPVSPQYRSYKQQEQWGTDEKVMPCQSVLCFTSLKSFENIIGDMVKKSLSPPFCFLPGSLPHSHPSHHCTYPPSISSFLLDLS